jgi:hypothetical protein
MGENVDNRIYRFIFATKPVLLNSTFSYHELVALWPLNLFTLILLKRKYPNITLEKFLKILKQLTLTIPHEACILKCMCHNRCLSFGSFFVSDLISMLFYVKIIF